MSHAIAILIPRSSTWPIESPASRLHGLCPSVSSSAGIEADNTFTTTVERALMAMAVTLVIGLVVGTMASKMLEENLKSHEEKLKKAGHDPSPG